MGAQANGHRFDFVFEVGDWVYLKLQPYRQTSVTFHSSMKLSPCFYSPFPIVERIGDMAYRLALSVESQIHNVFHINLLKRFWGPSPNAIPELPLTAVDDTILP